MYTYTPTHTHRMYRCVFLMIKKHQRVISYRNTLYNGYLKSTYWLTVFVCVFLLIYLYCALMAPAHIIGTISYLYSTKLLIYKTPHNSTPKWLIDGLQRVSNEQCETSRCSPFVAILKERERELLFSTKDIIANGDSDDLPITQTWYKKRKAYTKILTTS